jgi:hypothetical protein
MWTMFSIAKPIVHLALGAAVSSAVKKVARRSLHKNYVFNEGSKRPSSCMLLGLS